MEVVKMMEACGAADGKVNKRVVVAACGELYEGRERTADQVAGEWDEAAVMEKLGLSMEDMAALEDYYEEEDSDDEEEEETGAAQKPKQNK
jgi:hypothetical protein